MKEELITIIIPIYNAEKSIEKCVNSIIKQKYRNIEILLINDGSKDKSLDICKILKSRDNRIILIDKENEKVSKTRNRGIQEAKGKYIMFVDSDDYINEDMVKEMAKGIEEFDICTCNYNYVDNNKEIVRSKLSSFSTDENNRYIEILQRDLLFNPLWNKIYKTKIIKENNIKFEPNIQVGEDYLFNIDYMKHIQNANYISDPMYNYVIQYNSLSKRFVERSIKEEMKIPRNLKKYYEEQKYNMQYVYNQYIEILKSNILNLMVGEKDRNEIKKLIGEYIYEIKKDGIDKEKIDSLLTTENKFLYKALMKNKINYIYKYFKIRNLIKKKLLRR